MRRGQSGPPPPPRLPADGPSVPRPSGKPTVTTSRKTLTAAGLAALLALSLLALFPALASQSTHAAPASKWTKAPAKTQPLPVTVQGATVAAVPPSIKDTAAYMTLTNRSKQPIKLVGAATPLAAHPMLMITTRSGGMMGMKMVPSLTIPAGGKLTLHRGGDHVMLMGLKRPLKVGETVTLTLTAEDGRTLKVSATVKKN